MASLSFLTSCQSIPSQSPLQKLVDRCRCQLKISKNAAGRPKGSRNRRTNDNLDCAPASRCPVGRPRGTGHRQRDQDLLGNQGVVKVKRPVGRPKKVPRTANSLVEISHRIVSLLFAFYTLSNPHDFSPFPLRFPNQVLTGSQFG